MNYNYRQQYAKRVLRAGVPDNASVCFNGKEYYCT
jgi:hypothetical protein